MHVIKANDAATELVCFCPIYLSFSLLVLTLYWQHHAATGAYIPHSPLPANSTIVLAIMPLSNVLTPMPQAVRCLPLAPSSQKNKILSLHLRQTTDHITRHSSTQFPTLRAFQINSASTLTRPPHSKPTVATTTASTRGNVLEMEEGMPCQ